MNINLDLSVVIPTYNRKDVLKRCLESLFNQTYPQNKYEIIVVDDGSTDGTGDLVKELIKESACQLRYFKQENKGPAAARNVGIKNANGELILFTGDDCIADSHLLEEHMKYHNTYKDVAVLGYTTWHPDLKITPFMEYIVTSGIQFGYPLIKDKNNVPFNFFYTSNISIKKELLIHADLFDEDFKYAAWEDVELGYRLNQRGIKIVYNKEAITYHNHPTTVSKFCERQKKTGMSAVVFYKKHPEMKKWLKVSESNIRIFKIKLATNFFRILSALGRTKFRNKLYQLILSYNYMIGVKEGLEGWMKKLNISEEGKHI